MSKEHKPWNQRFDQGLGWLALMLSLALFITPILLPICQGLVETRNGMPLPMKCHWSYRIETVLAVLSIGLAGLYFGVKNAEVRQYFGLGFLVIGVLAVLTPTDWIIGVCKGSHMPCRTTTAWMWTWGGLLAVNGLGIIVRQHQRSQTEKCLRGVQAGTECRSGGGDGPAA